MRGLLIGAVLAASFEARAQEPAKTAADAKGTPDVEGHLDRALKHFNSRQYAEAAQEFRRAYEKKPSGDYLYAWAQSERLSGNCANAVPLYEQYLTREPGGANAEVARINLARCKTLAAGAGGEGAAAQPGLAKRADAPAVPPPPHEPWYKDVVAAMLAGASVAAFGAAVGFKITADRSADARADARSYDVFDSRANAVERWDSLATAGVIAGSTLLVTSAARYIWRATR